MPPKREWSAADIDTIRYQRASGLSWQAIADILGINRNAVVGKAVGIGLWQRGPAPTPTPEPKSPTLRTEGLPFPPGHPFTWGLITVGTCLEGVPYPRPKGIGPTRRPIHKPSDVKEPA